MEYTIKFPHIKEFCKRGVSATDLPNFPKHGIFAFQHGFDAVVKVGVGEHVEVHQPGDRRIALPHGQVGFPRLIDGPVYTILEFKDVLGDPVDLLCLKLSPPGQELGRIFDPLGVLDGIGFPASSFGVRDKRRQHDGGGIRKFANAGRAELKVRNRKVRPGGLAVHRKRGDGDAQRVNGSKLALDAEFEGVVHLYDVVLKGGLEGVLFTSLRAQVDGSRYQNGGEDQHEEHGHLEPKDLLAHLGGDDLGLGRVLGRRTCCIRVAQGRVDI
mmetsp:Transcript_61773/g.93278  ORF Transcript_61773/g.93278 Transcript_61773/m.93278 type:complete len:270 (+) Transcript_61773:3822-4631(+)